MKYVYILKAGGDHYKVGVAKSVTRRVAELQTGNAYKVYVVAMRLCKDAEKVEYMIHNKLIDMAAAGGTEWFKLTPEDVIRVCILLNSQPEIDVYDNATLNDQLDTHTNILKSINRNVKAIMTAKAQALSNAQVQVNNTVGVISTVEDNKHKKERRDNELYLEALKIVISANTASTSLLQRKLSIGYGRAARIIEELEKNGIIGSADGPRPRQIIQNK